MNDSMWIVLEQAGFEFFSQAAWARPANNTFFDARFSNDFNENWMFHPNQPLHIGHELLGGVKMMKTTLTKRNLLVCF